MLRRLYTSDYADRIGDPQVANTTDFHLSVCVVADKYMLAELNQEALSRFRTQLEEVDEAELTRIIDKVHYEAVTYPATVIRITNEIRDLRLNVLLKNDHFRALMRSDSALCMAVVDRLSDLSKVSWATGLVERSFHNLQRVQAKGYAPHEDQACASWEY